MRRQHPITHGAITGAENHNSPLDGNDIEMSTEPQENNQMVLPPMRLAIALQKMKQ